jgi:hypothetical protein
LTRDLRVVLVAAVTAAAIGTAPIGVGLAAPAKIGGAKTRYAKVHRVCARPGPKRAACLVETLIPAPAGAAGAHPYRAAAGATSVGPAGGLTPADLAGAYSYSPVGGSGQTVAIVDAFDDPNIEHDLGTFSAQYGLSACTSANGCFEKVGQTGSPTSLPPADTVGWSVEMALDVETVHSVCESCRIVLVEANTERFTDLSASVNEAVSLGAGEVSNSYGQLETAVSPQELVGYNHPGIVITASSGDSGYLNWDDIAKGAAAPEMPDVPASLGSVVAVGGTALRLTSAGARESEAVWNDSGRPSGEEFKQFSGTGGGCSTLFAAPAWQQGAVGWASAACGTKRLDNDVAAVGDPYTGFDIYDTYAYEPKFTAGWRTVGGTSLSSPLVAALFALAGGSQGVGYPASTLYGHAGQGSLYDVVEGGNGYCDGEAPGPCGEPEINELFGNIDCQGTTACDAAPGFDGPSGLGTPKGLAAFTATKSKPTVLTEPAGAVMATSAVLHATVNPNGQSVTACEFEYGPTTGYGASAPCSSLPGSGTTPVAVSATVSGLSTNTTYHFRILATNATGTGEGNDQTFTTGNPPEYGRCLKLAKGVKGVYATATCTSPATAEKFSYEWTPGPGPKAKFTDKIKELTLAVIETVSKRQVVCTGESATGEYAGRKALANLAVTFTGCEMEHTKCSSTSHAEGELVSAQLAGSLGIVTKSVEGPLNDKVAVDLFPVAEGGPVLEFHCGATGVTVKGSVLYPVASDKMTAKGTLKYSATSGRQKPEGFEGLPRDVLAAAFGEAAFEQAALKLTTVRTNEQPIEINTVI